jgi:mannonate dehydratase
MSFPFSRRTALQAAAGVALAPRPAVAATPRSWPIPEGADTPKLCLGSTASNDGAIRRLKQIGIDHVLMGGPPIPWNEDELRARIERLRAGGLTLCNMMISGFPKAIYGRPGRDEEIDKVRQSIRAAGKAGLPVVEYNWYAHRAMEGYYEEAGRAGAGYTAFDYERIRGLPPLPDEGAHTAEEMWANIGYFLKAVVPAAEEAGVRLALHPNDPPAPLSRGSEQLMGSVAGWKRLVDIVPSPSNGITFDCGVTREMGENPVEVCRWFASRRRINHVHFRNVRVRRPYEQYVEVFIDEGQVDMFGVMKELVRNRYTGAIYPEHPRALDYDRERGPIKGYPGGGGYAGEVYSVGYARAMLQAALES